MGGGTAEQITHAIQTTRTKHDEAITDVILHLGSNNLNKDHDVVIANKIISGLEAAKNRYTNADIYYSPMLPQINNTSIGRGDTINKIVKHFCSINEIHFIENRTLFINRKAGIRLERLSSYYKIHPNREGNLALGKHLKFFISTEYGKFSLPPPPYSPGR